MSVKILWRGDKVKVGFLGRLDTKSFTPEPNQCFKCLRYGLIVAMPRSARQTRGSQSKMRKLPGRTSSLEPALSRAERNSPGSDQTHPCPTLTRTGQTKSPGQEGLPGRTQNPANPTNTSQTWLYNSHQNPSGEKAPTTTTSTKECQSGTGNKQREKGRKTEACVFAKRRGEGEERKPRKKLQCQI